MDMRPLDSHRRFYDRISTAYDLWCDVGERPARVAGVSLLALRPGETVLEIDCRTGNELGDLGSRVGAAGLLGGIDPSGEECSRSPAG